MSNSAFTADGDFSVTPSDTAANYCAAFEVSTDGNIHYLCNNGTERTRAVTAGRIYPIRLKKVFATGTTATGIIGYLY